MRATPPWFLSSKGAHSPSALQPAACRAIPVAVGRCASVLDRQAMQGPVTLGKAPHISEKQGLFSLIHPSFSF